MRGFCCQQCQCIYLLYPLKQYLIDLSTGYANLCHCVIAPTASVATLIKQRGVRTRVEVVPTGIDVGYFSHGSGDVARRQFNIPADAFVFGSTGRLTREKNLEFLLKAKANLLSNVLFLVPTLPLHSAIELV